MMMTMMLTGSASSDCLTHLVPTIFFYHVFEHDTFEQVSLNYMTLLNAFHLIELSMSVVWHIYQGECAKGRKCSYQTKKNEIATDVLVLAIYTVCLRHAKMGKVTS